MSIATALRRIPPLQSAISPRSLKPQGCLDVLASGYIAIEAISRNVIQLQTDSACQRGCRAPDHQRVPVIDTF